MSEYKEIKNYEGYEPGMKVTILKSPSSWASTLNRNCPFNKLKYPYVCVIQKIAISGETGVIAMTEGKYGWALDTLVDNNIIKMDIKDLRKHKLNKIKKEK